jgi:hypothetical protein
MPTNKQDQQATGTPEQGRRERDTLLGGQVLRALGRPAALRGVHVRQLWEDHYRVNVLVGADAASARVLHSFFLVTDGDGNVLTAAPKITRRYE